jgi:hypothetical protein
MTPVYGLWTLLSRLPIYQLSSRQPDILTGSPYNNYTKVRRRYVRGVMVLSIFLLMITRGLGVGAENESEILKYQCIQRGSRYTTGAGCRRMLRIGTKW